MGHEEISTPSRDRPSPRLERWLFPVVFLANGALLVASILEGDLKHVGFHAGALFVFVALHHNRWMLHLAFGSPAFKLDRIAKPELFVVGSIVAYGSLWAF